MTNVFIDGSAGTTGLRIHERLAARTDIRVVTLPDELRKDNAARRDALNAADIAFLCLPDDAAREAVAMVDEASHTAIIDTSTAHRVAPGWTYGFPELGDRRAAIAKSERVANPGCHASGFLALVTPLVERGMMDKEAMLTAFSLTGYTGGGKKMIADYETDGRDGLLDAPRQYGLTQKHKHLPEMTAVSGLATLPVFCPIVGDFPCGMEVTVPLFASQVKGSAEEVAAVYRDYYQNGMVRFMEDASEGGFLSAGAMAGRDDMIVTVHGNPDRLILTARFDNLGKGASGAAIQNMNILLGVDEKTGLVC